MKPIHVDVVTVKKLVLIKQFYADAIARAALQSNISRVISVVELDLAVEALLKAIIAHCDQSRVPKDGFNTLIDQADNALQKAGYQPLPDKTNIRHVHSIRNDAQHKAKYPTREMLSDCRTYTRDFIEKVLKEVWDIELSNLALTDLIQHEEVKQYLCEAEVALDEGDYQLAVERAHIGLKVAVDRSRPAFVGRLPMFVRGIKAFDVFRQPATEQDEQTVWQMLERMNETLFYVALGLDYSQYELFTNLAGHVSFTLDGKGHVDGMKSDISQADAESAVAYCIDTVIEIEKRVGDLERPLGREHWWW